VRIPQGRSPMFEVNFPRVAWTKRVPDRVRPAAARVASVSRR
jgi:hypothetical protein